MHSSTQKTTSELAFLEKELTDYHGTQVLPMRAITFFSSTFCLPCDISRSLFDDDVSQRLQQILPEQEAPAIACILRNFAEMLIIRYKAKAEEYNDFTDSQLPRKQRLIAEHGEAVVTDFISRLEVRTGTKWEELSSILCKKIRSLLLSQTLPQLTAAEVKQEMYEPMLHRLFGVWCTQTNISEEDAFEAVHQWSVTKQDGAVVAVDIPTCIARYTPKSYESYQHPHLLSELQRAFHALLECHKKFSVLGVSTQTLSELKCLVVFGSPDRAHIATVRLEQNSLDREMYPIIALTSCYFDDVEISVTWFLHQILRLMLQQRREIAKITTAVCSNEQQLETPVGIQAAWERSALIPRLAVCDQFGTTPNPPYVSQECDEKKTTEEQLNTAVQCFTSEVQALELLKAKGINLNLRSTTEISVKNGDYTEHIIKLLCKLLHLDVKLGIIAFQELQKTILRQSKVVRKESLSAIRTMYLVAYEEMTAVTQLQSPVEQLHFIKNILTAAASIHSVGLVHGNINNQAMMYSKVKDEYYLSISHARFVITASLFKPSLYIEYQAPENLESPAMDSWSIGMAFGSILLRTEIKKEYSSFQNKALLLLSLQKAKATSRISEGICDLIEKLVEEDSNKRLSCKDALHHACFTA